MGEFGGGPMPPGDQGGPPNQGPPGGFMSQGELMNQRSSPDYLPPGKIKMCPASWPESSDLF